MTNENKTPNEAARSEDMTQRSPDGFRRFIVVSGLVRLLIASFLTWGLLFAEGPEGDTFPNGFLEGVGCGLFLTASWLLTASGLLLASRRRRLRHAYRLCREGACASLLLCLLAFALRDALDPEAIKPFPPMPFFAEGGPVRPWAVLATGAMAFLFANTNWKPKHLRGAASSSEPSPGSPLLRPLNALLDVPLLGEIVGIALLWLFVVFSVGGILYIAERIGTCFAAPKLGVAGVFFFVLMAPPVYWMEDWDLMGKRTRG